MHSRCEDMQKCGILKLLLIYFIRATMLHVFVACRTFPFTDLKKGSTHKHVGNQICQTCKRFKCERTTTRTRALLHIQLPRNKSNLVDSCHLACLATTYTIHYISTCSSPLVTPLVSDIQRRKALSQNFFAVCCYFRILQFSFKCTYNCLHLRILINFPLIMKLIFLRSMRISYSISKISHSRCQFCA